MMHWEALGNLKLNISACLKASMYDWIVSSSIPCTFARSAMHDHGIGNEPCIASCAGQACRNCSACAASRCTSKQVGVVDALRARNDLLAPDEHIEGVADLWVIWAWHRVEGPDLPHWALGYVLQ
jgi:hypothetical protein